MRAPAEPGTLRSSRMSFPHFVPEPEPPIGPRARVADLLFGVKPRVSPAEFWGHVVVYAVFFVWGWTFVLMDFRSNDAASSFMHSVDLVFHEAGHVLFRPFGDFMTVLGGSLMQLIVPAVVVAAFLWKRDAFGAAVGLWWLGQNFVDLAPYIYDASRLVLPLLGGVTGADVPGYHDWNNILRRLDMLESDWLVAKWSARIGAWLILGFMAWGGALLVKEYRNLDAAFSE